MEPEISYTNYWYSFKYKLSKNKLILDEDDRPGWKETQFTPARRGRPRRASTTEEGWESSAPQRCCAPWGWNPTSRARQSRRRTVPCPSPLLLKTPRTHVNMPRVRSPSAAAPQPKSLSLVAGAGIHAEKRWITKSNRISFTWLVCILYHH